MADHRHSNHDCCSHVHVLQPDDLCACGSQKPFKECCEPFLLGTCLPKTPEALMRSRYTAYTQANIDYIEKTLCGPAAQGFDKEEVTHWAHHLDWQGLEVLHVQGDEREGQVMFIAHYAQNGQAYAVNGNSLFRRIRGQWFYVDEIKSQKTGRNDPCTCGSGKKYKKCCGL